jgi:hypothetical protein
MRGCDPRTHDNKNDAAGSAPEAGSKSDQAVSGGGGVNHGRMSDQTEILQNLTSL